MGFVMAGMGLAQMNLLLSLDTTKARMNTLNTVKTGIEGRIRTEKNEENKQALQERLDGVLKNIAQSTQEVQDRIAAGQENAREEEEAKESAARKAEKVAVAGGPGLPPISGMPLQAVDAAYIADLSMFAQNVAASMPVGLPEIPMPQPVQVGGVMHIKV